MEKGLVLDRGNSQESEIGRFQVELAKCQTSKTFGQFVKRRLVQSLNAFKAV